MAKKQSFKPNTIVRFNGRFNFRELYDFFMGMVASDGFTVIEESYAQKAGSAGEGVEIGWGFEKLIDDYTKFVIEILFFVENMKDIVVKKGDKEIKTNQGDIFIKIKGYVVTDRLGNWETSKFFEKLRDFYEAYLFWRTLDGYNGTIYKFVHFFASEVKAFLELPGFM